MGIVSGRGEVERRDGREERMRVIGELAVGWTGKEWGEGWEKGEGCEW